MEVDPSECVVFEDADAGIVSARDAGCKVVGVKSEFTLYQTLDDVDRVLDSLEDIDASFFASVQ